MKCAICGLEVETIDEAIDQGWIPYAWEGDQEQEGPFCTSCSETLIQIDEDGEFAVKEEYRGKLVYLEGDFFEEELLEHMSAGFMLEYCDN